MQLLIVAKPYWSFRYVYTCIYNIIFTVCVCVCECVCVCMCVCVCVCVCECVCIANANGIAHRQPFGETVKTNAEEKL